MNTVFAILSIFAVQRKEFFILQNKFLRQKNSNIAHFYVFCAFLVFGKAMKRMVIFASGDGTNAENIIRYFHDNEMVEVVSVYSENASARVHHRAKRLGIPSITFPKESLSGGTSVLKKLAEDGADFIVLAGFLKKIPDAILRAYPKKILNIHPALLPKHGGKECMVCACIRLSWLPAIRNRGLPSILSTTDTMKGKLFFRRVVRLLRPILLKMWRLKYMPSNMRITPP